MKTLPIITATVIAAILAVPASAHWDTGDPFKMHWPQMPDLETGLDVLATVPKVLADDFLCTQTGPITSIHVWGSWLNDEFPIDPDETQNPGNVTFRLSLHKNIPAPSPDEFSRPGEEIWHGYFSPGSFKWRVWAENLREGFFDPNIPPGQDPIIGHDSMVIQYNFHIPYTSEPPMQEEGNIYWLDLMAIPPVDQPAMTLFGWKSSLDAFEDDAVYGHVRADGTLLNDWQPLIYPVGHPLEGKSLDLAFVIVPEPATMSVLLAGSLMVLLRRRRS